MSWRGARDAAILLAAALACCVDTPARADCCWWAWSDQKLRTTLPVVRQSASWERRQPVPVARVVIDDTLDYETWKIDAWLNGTNDTRDRITSGLSVEIHVCTMDEPTAGFVCRRVDKLDTPVSGADGTGQNGGANLTRSIHHAPHARVGIVQWEQAPVGPVHVVVFARAYQLYARSGNALTIDSAGVIVMRSTRPE